MTRLPMTETDELAIRFFTSWGPDDADLWREFLGDLEKLLESAKNEGKDD